jgi:hypothetical protein
MAPELHELHLQAGLKAGLERTCGKKIPWPDEERANKAAASMNKKPTTRNVLEAYPCPFCKEWHIGRKMSLEELQAAIS